ncbi:MAG: L-serine ammonia-lyase, iron-sulfur-dependent, subunit alpha [Candidatus Limiplasma sp.]|nr:L-serine ammonia-lyase, iron-sulfur-dependent, subunit alpha [Candidatus Limiplasma sp.]
MRTIAELYEAARERNQSLGEAALAWQMAESKESEAAVRGRMAQALAVMKDSVQAGLDPELRSVSGMVGGGAARMANPAQAGRFGLLGKAAAYALSVAESNACMGKIVAAPTAGSCGILPGALLAAQEEMGFSQEELVMALFAAAAVGRVIALSATISGAQGGCQAECGSAAAMTAAALTQLYGGTPKQACDAGGFALMNMMGLVCDPVHGLVEVPCVYRNVGGVSQALAAAQMALSGVACPIDVDELITAMKEVGESMPPSLRETGEGGCASCAGCGR